MQGNPAPPNPSSPKLPLGEDYPVPAPVPFQGRRHHSFLSALTSLCTGLYVTVLAHISGATSQPGVSLVYPRPSRNVSLRLQGLQEKDSGSYRCSVNVQDKQGTSRGHDSKTLKLDVWVPPAPPSCHLLGAPRVGTNVTLSCKSPRSKPAALYQWERLQPSVEVFFAPVLGEELLETETLGLGQDEVPEGLG
ncbi:Endothelial cell-selective adhesion molecule [Myotis brandtii]|uniref:Endothelial cell-selective adhesion molecule n=1 Tax=Myotis brandtii TaxID=109478 RepID=S7N927_MYOBR|nr:Endothelial cell-selective adhesion molecule [Myotis brandtii]